MTRRSDDPHGKLPVHPSPMHPSPTHPPAGSPAGPPPGPAPGRPPVTSLLWAAWATVLVLAGCQDLTTQSDSQAPPRDFSGLQCSLPSSQIFDGGVGADGIPSLQDPGFVPANHPSVGFLELSHPFPDVRVIGIEHDGQAYAVPHNILWWHEIANIDFDSETRVAVTYCPLTGSALTFDREVIRGGTLGVSGLIFQNNLMMFDRTGNTLFPQMMRTARCGSQDGLKLPMVPTIEMNWSEWVELHPGTLVLSGNTGFARDYTRYPYGNYEENSEFLFPVNSLDDRRPAKERILGYPIDGSSPSQPMGGVALPFGELDRAAAPHAGVAAIPVDLEGDKSIVLWSRAAQGGAFFRPVTDEGVSVRIEASDGAFIDAETGSEWSLDGRAIDGPLAGQSLVRMPNGYVAFWFAWEAFHPETDLWLHSESLPARSAALSGG
ncbi:MAG: DUF3179 domain-containing protein [Gemmatimonadales bacterium]|nr:MAG: DUF3179 domain-containing protein [Gemmatimonadales bacterium]